MNDPKNAAKAIRKSLKDNFKGTKFSVRCDRVNCIRIQYDNGPRQESVKELVAKHQSGHYNMETDIHENNYNEFPQVEFLTITRDISEKFLAKVRADIVKYYAIEDPSSDRSWFDFFRMWPSEVIWQKANEQDIPAT